MTHRSRLTAVLVDVPASDHEAAATFWSAALGKPADRLEKYPEYAFLGQATPGVEFMVQGTGDPGPRVHFDIESDDVEAEVRRLEALGARRTEKVETWWKLLDPAGQPFCVTEVQTEGFADATTWE